MKSKQIEEIEEAESEGESSIELKQPTPIVPVPKKERKPFVLTDKRKEAFEKARLKRQENVQLRKLQQKQLQDEQEAIKQAVIDKRNQRLVKKNKKEIKKIIANEDLLDSSSDEEIIVRKKKTARKKKSVIYLEKDDSESEPESEVVKQVPTPATIPRRIINYY
jgi:tRNA A37 threonylcarbamoyladenosine modification protein TsaB